MGLAKRIIPCLDVNAGRVVKGINFIDLQDAGDPVEIAKKYNEEGADEITFLDITASSDNRDLILDIIESVAKQIFIPLTVGGGVRSPDDVRRLLNAGADKISINTSAIINPELVAEVSSRFGSQCIVVAIDAKKVGNQWEVFTHGGRKSTGLDAVEWAKRMVDLGAGELQNVPMQTFMRNYWTWQRTAPPPTAAPDTRPLCPNSQRRGRSVCPTNPRAQLRSP